MRNATIKVWASGAVLSILLLASCKKDEVNTLTVSPTNISLPKEGGSVTITIATDAASWNINNPASDWISLSNSSGTGKSMMITLHVDTRKLQARTDTLLVTAGHTPSVQVIVNQEAAEYLYALTANLRTLSFGRSPDTVTLMVTTDAPEWNLTADADWVSFSQVTGTTGSTIVRVAASENTGTVQRSDSILLTAANADTLVLVVSQLGQLYPSYNVAPLSPDITGMGSNAVTVSSKMKIGWNLGNSLEAIGSNGEMSWGNPYVTKAFIDLIKSSGFNAIRIPCSWNQYVTDTATAEIDVAWLKRVKEVVQYCVDDSLYVILNIHWDGGWLENNCTTAKQERNNAKQKAFWEQIATYMRDFDEHLLFASANEPNVEIAEEMTVLKSYHQTFVDAVRSTGGKNSYRVLVVQRPSTDIETTNDLMSALPTDEIDNHLMVEIHYYTPFNFCGLTADASWGKMFYYWGAKYHSSSDASRNATWGEESTVNSNFTLMKTKFVDHGIPVIMGEYSVTRRSSLTGDNLTLHLNSRAYYFRYVTQQAKANGIVPFYWDNGSTDNYGCALFNRNTLAVFDQQALDSLMVGASK